PLGDGGYFVGGLLVGGLIAIFGARWAIDIIGIVVLLMTILLAWRLQETHHLAGSQPAASHSQVGRS
ncbi:MAG: hypothetical protein M1318_07145, partial [Firmicutes bacterium]|nr:hypothetical protein [Bacillota bacterium]